MSLGGGRPSAGNSFAKMEQARPNNFTPKLIHSVKIVMQREEESRREKKKEKREVENLPSLRDNHQECLNLAISKNRSD